MFELYDSLQLQSKTIIEKIDLLKLKQNITELDDEGQTYVFALVYYHYKFHTNDAQPQLSEFVSIDLSSLPKDLLKIIYKFTLMHLHRMNETSEMSHAQRLITIINDNKCNS